MDTKSRLAEDPGGGQNSDEMSPQERLQRLADAFDAGQDWPDGHILELVAAAQDRPARAEVAPSAETRGKGSDWWRNVALFLAIVVVVTAVAGVLLRVLAPTQVGQDGSPGPATTGPLQPASQAAPMTTPVQPPPPQAATEPNVPKAQPANRAPAHFIPWSPPQNNPISAAPAPAPSLPKPSVDSPPKPSATAATSVPDSTRPDPGRPPASQRSTNAVADPSPTAGAATVSDADSAPSALSIYYQTGSSLAEDNARSLGAQLGSNVASVALKAAQTDAKGAVIRYSSGKSHALARSIGPLLTNMGYTWRIEGGSNSVESQRGTIEVWLPSK
jgi:hypothetical protein